MHFTGDDVEEEQYLQVRMPDRILADFKFFGN
jgi:hypothetical protein